VQRENLSDLMEWAANTQNTNHRNVRRNVVQIGSCLVGYCINQEHFYRHKWNEFEIVLASGGDSQTFYKYIEPFSERSKFVLHLYH
jgi:hypothetical protein